jgi:hypothetical protein
MKIVWAIFDPGWLSRRGSSRIENDALRRHGTIGNVNLASGTDLTEAADHLRGVSPHP